MNLITPTQLYWLTRCDSIKSFLSSTGFFDLITVLSIFIFIASCALYFIVRYVQDSDFDDEKRCLAGNSLLKCAKITLLVALSSILIKFSLGMARTFVPTTKEMAAIIVIPRIANSQSVQELGSDVVELAKSWMLELKPKSVSESVTNVAGEKAK